MSGALVIKALLSTKELIEFFGIADSTATGHNKPNAIGGGYIGFFNPFGNNTGNSPRIGRCGNNQLAVHSNWGMVAVLYFFVQINNGITELVGNEFGNISTVART